MQSAIELAEQIEAMGAFRAAAIEVDAIPFDTAFRDACRQNSCGFYNRCWTCPPDAGEIDELIARVRAYRYAVAFQTVSSLEDSYDMEGMHAAAAAHNRLTLKIQDLLSTLAPESMVLGAGACGICKTCTKPDGLPCRFPDRAILSLEACGIDVSALAKRCGLRYINGKNTVTYFGIALYEARGPSRDQDGVSDG
ncbi:MAG: DUF2284 domain-containing protein [Clostridiales bacterium]|nr:DUF2284 domain-containing protein [Clostridiales bacterium]